MVFLTVYLKITCSVLILGIFLSKILIVLSIVQVALVFGEAVSSSIVLMKFSSARFETTSFFVRKSLVKVFIFYYFIYFLFLQ